MLKKQDLFLIMGIGIVSALIFGFMGLVIGYNLGFHWYGPVVNETTFRLVDRIEDNFMYVFALFGFLLPFVIMPSIRFRTEKQKNFS